MAPKFLTDNDIMQLDAQSKPRPAYLVDSDIEELDRRMPKQRKVAFLPNLYQTEQKIKERGSQFKGLQDIAQQIKEHPFKTLLSPTSPLAGGGMMPGGLQQAVGQAAFGTVEAPVASAMLDIQKGQQVKTPMEAFKRTGQAIIGKRQAQLGDVIRTTGFGGALNEPIAATVGTLGMAGLTGGLSGGKSNQAIKTVGKDIAGQFKQSPEKLLSKAEKLTTEILQPSKQELAGYIAQGKKMPAIEEAMTAIKKSKNYGELKGNIDNVISNTMNFRNKILRENNRPIGDYTKPLQNYIAELKTKGQLTPPELEQLQGVLKREREFLSNRTLDRISGQDRKEYLQKLTDTLLQKSEKGMVIDTQPARTRALDLLRKGLKQEIEGNDYKIAELNSRYGGLLRAKELIAGQEALAQKAIPQNMLQKIFRLLTNPKDIPEEIARAAFDRQSNLLGQTRKISKLVKKAGVK